MKQVLLVYDVGMSAGMGHEYFGAAPQHIYLNRIPGPFLVLLRGCMRDRPCSPVALVLDLLAVVLQTL